MPALPGTHTHTQVFHGSPCHGYSSMGPPGLVAFTSQAAPEFIAHHSMEKARISHAIWGCFSTCLVFFSFSCTFQLIPMTTTA